ncbi:uncharacterized protein LOC143298321 [Babylonia areolata]|uniref:uncharacterized protein LOC143298321 n=1 Tax=Babylonia areolata TaxID=304850 RepID=UPI003FD02C11
MNPVKTLAALVLLFTVCDLALGRTSARVGSLFSRFFPSARLRQPQATCDWLSDASLLKELKWTERADLCLETGPQFQYPAKDVETALRNDPAAAQYLSYLTQCYAVQNQTYYQAWNQQYYTQDLCPVRPQLVDKVWRYNDLDRKMDHCYIVHPQLQRVEMAQCGDGLGTADSQKCKMDLDSHFQGNYYCVPDGYAKRVVLVYCPWAVENQCTVANVRVPTGCSCKQYTCDKTRVRTSGSFSSFASRFQG